MKIVVPIKEIVDTNSLDVNDSEYLPRDVDNHEC